MSKRDRLVPLIASLNPNEKRYFKLFSSIQPGEKEYLKLFDALDGKDVYDAATLSKELGVTPARLAETKHYLTQAIFRCLRNFEDAGSETPDEHLVDIGRADAQALMSRGLYEYALEIVEKAAAKAVELDMFETAINLLSKKWNCQYNLGQFENIQNTFDERDKLVKIQEEISGMFRLNVRTVELERKRAGMKDFEQILRHPLKKKPDSLVSVKAQLQWFEIKQRCYTAGGFEPSYGLNNARMQLKYYKKHSRIQKLVPMAMFHSYGVLADAELAAGDAAKGLELLNQLEEWIEHGDNNLSRGSRVAMKGHVYVHGLEMRFSLGQYKGIIADAEKAGNFIEQRPAYEQFVVLFYMSLAYLHLKQSDLALIKLNELVQLNTEERSNMQMYTRPVMILCQLDLGNYQVVPYLIKSAKSWMKRKKWALPELEVFFSLTYAIANAPQTMRRQRWLKLQEAVELGKLDGMDKQVNLKQWLERKLTRQE